MRPLFDSMQALDCDFWGLVENNEFRPHLQSFFIALKHNALKHPAFSTFLNNIEPSDKREDSIQYEVKLTQWLISQNLVGATRFPAPSSDYPYTSLHHYTTLFLQSGYFPFVKRRMLFNNPIAANLRKLPALIKNKGYPVDLIVSYAKRCNMKLDHEF
jgi:lipopolysaccharide biosynthesis protein